MAVLTSIASDFDIASDWFFLRASYLEDREYRAAYAADPEEGRLPYLIPDRMLHCVLFFCCMGTIMYLIIATEGRILAPIYRRMGVDRMSMGFLLFVGILVEDMPQCVLTFLVEDYYEEEFDLSQMAVLNLTSSLYDTCIKIAESYDQRHDVVETGIWCKSSIRGHEGVVTDVLVLPEGSGIVPPPPPLTPLLAEQPPTISARQGRSKSLPISFRRMSRKPLLVNTSFADEEAASPGTYLLSASLDKTVKLWRVASAGEEAATKKETCVWVYRDGDSGGFTCLAWVGHKSATEVVVGRGDDRHMSTGAISQAERRQSHFLTGCNKGSVKLWDLSGGWHATYRTGDDMVVKRGRAASIATTSINGRHAFVCGHESGSIRLWDTWSVFCMGEIEGHRGRVNSLSFLLEGAQFVSASADATLKLWDIGSLLQKKMKETEVGVEVDADGTHATNSPVSSDARREQFVVLSTVSKSADIGKDAVALASSVKEFVGHRAAVFSVVSVDQKSAILSGSKDGTARLWSIKSGVCLRIFRGHSNGVHSVLAIDRVTFLTGSSDRTIKAWDALSGDCLRTYDGHRNTVTGLFTVSAGKEKTDGATTFVSSSADKSIKCWVLTAVSYRDPAAALDDILEYQDGACCRPQGRCDFDHSYSYYEEAPL